MADQAFAWRAREHEHRDHQSDWYWSVAIVAAAIIVASVMLGNTLFAVVVLVATTALVIQTMKRPDELDFALTERGVQIQNKLYPYSTLESFWATEDSLLLIKSEKTFMPHLVIPFHPDDEDTIRAILLQVMKEEEQHESLAEIIMHRLGF